MPCPALNRREWRGAAKTAANARWYSPLKFAYTVPPKDWDDNGVSVPAGDTILPAISPISLVAGAIVSLRPTGAVTPTGHLPRSDAGRVRPATIPVIMPPPTAGQFPALAEDSR